MPRADLLQRPGEDDRQHRAFLLWAMQAAAKRSKRRVSLALRVNEKSVRNWYQTHAWEERVRDVEAPRHASELYAAEHHTRHGGRELRVIEDLLAAPYEEPPTAAKTAKAKIADAVEEVEREEERKRERAKLKTRMERVETVADATIVRLGQRLAKGEIDLKLGDLGHAVRAYQLVEEMQLRREAMMPDPNAKAAGENGVTVAATSQRVLLAQKNGGDVEAALEADAEELLLIIRTRREQLRVARAQVNGGVVPFPDRSEEG